MKRLVSPVLLLVLLAGASIVSSPKTTNGQSAGLVSSVLHRMERNRQSLRSLKATLSMEKYIAHLRDKENYSGWVLYVPAPAGASYVLNGKGHKMNSGSSKGHTRYFAPVCQRSLAI